ncbi:aquaporin AQPAe.a [Calliopsis andreniformis]|uniref:aquaporin AQPAe.a n=1 Tax=Calliopsis andreniformis TaxID=337506 RepID=UPI003FCE4D4F
MVAAEVLGTAILLFVGCMGSLGTMGPSPPSQLQASIAFGMTVNLLIMMLGHISGAHLNPAVTIGAIIVGVRSIPTGVLFIVGQFLGAIIGYKTLMLITPLELFNDGRSDPSIGHCVTVVHPNISIATAILIEIFCTSFILCAACGTWDPRCAHTTDSTALRFGFSVVGISVAASPYTGCSMNPARTFAPALWNGNWANQWIYWLGPTLGALLGTYTYQFLFALKEKEIDDNHDGLAMGVVDTLPSIDDNLSIVKGKNLEITHI